MKQVKRSELEKGKKYWIEMEFVEDDGSDRCPLYFDVVGLRFWFEDCVNIARVEEGKAEESPKYLKNIIKKLEDLDGHNRNIWLNRIMGEFGDEIRTRYIINQIDEPQKQKVPQVAVEFYERYKDDNLDLGEWFGDFYSDQAIEEFPRLEELAEWLHDNDNEINRQREFALATLVTLGIDAVEVEQEELYTVEIPNPNRKGKKKVMLIKDAYGDIILGKRKESVGKNNRLTEAEIKQDFDWAWQWAVPVEGEEL